MTTQIAISRQTGLPIYPAAKVTTPNPESVGACIERIFTAFYHAMKKLIADIESFFQNLLNEGINNYLETKTLRIEPATPRQKIQTAFPSQAQPVEKVQPVQPPTPAGEEKPQLLLNERVGLDKAQSPVAEPEPTTLTAYQREHRIRKGAANIQTRLEREWQHAQNQMAREKDAEFLYQEAPNAFNPPTEEGRIGNYEMGLCHFQGSWRDSMEDEHLAKVFKISIGESSYDIPLFAVMDGHGGVVCAEFVRDNLQQTLEETLTEFNPQSLTDEGIWNALKHTGVRLHERFCAKYFLGENEQERNTSGTTLVFSMIFGDKLWTANIGDSRAVLDNNGEVLQLSEDAKPADPTCTDEEITRYNRGILNRGGTIHTWDIPRINDRLACARSIGDPMVYGANSARAKITMRALDSLSPNSYLILGCDGIFDVASTKQIGNVVHQNSSLKLGTLAKNIVYSTETSNTKDNQSILIVRLK